MFGSRASQRTINRQQYIPPHIQQAINQHLQTTVHGDAQRYMNGGLVPKQAQRAIAKQLNKMPAHLKQYSGAYMEQNIMSPSRVVAPRQPSEPALHPPTPDMLNLSHSGAIPVQQFSANLSSSKDLFAPDQSPVPAASENPEPSYPAPPPSNDQQNQNPYDFITSPTQPKQSLNFLNGAPKFQKILLLGGAAIVLIVLFSIFYSFLSRSPGTTDLISLVEQQGEIIQTTISANDNASQQVTKNLAINISLGLGTNQAQLTTYLGSIGKKVSSKSLELPPPASITTQLTNAQSASNFDPVYVQITQSQLTSYINQLKQVYNSAPSKAEKTLLAKQSQDANLLLNQANSVSSSLSP